MLNGMAGQAIMAVVWLGAVLVLILAASRGARLFPSLRATMPAGELVLRGSLALDTRRRLLLVQAGPHRILVLSGGAGESLVVLPNAETRTC